MKIVDKVLRLVGLKREERPVDLDALHKFETIPVDEDGFCVCHGYDAVFKGRPRKELRS